MSPQQHISQNISNMKKFYSILIAALTAVFVFTACGNEPTPEPGPATIVGSWLTDSVVTVYENGEREVTDYEGISLVLNFDADGHFNDNGGLAANYVVNDNQLTFNYTGTLEGISETYDIDELTQSTLVYAANVEDTVNYRISFHHHRIK